MRITRKKTEKMKMKMWRVLKEGLRRDREMYWKELYCQPPIRILVLFFVYLNIIDEVSVCNYMSGKIMRLLENRMKLESEDLKRKKPHEKFMDVEVKSKTDRIY